MIRVEKIAIHEFRGIRDLTLQLNGKTFAVCGPNGTGKSGIVDALEFALTGNISRLSGTGTGDISVKEHGPHVDSRNKPEQASVTLTVSIPSLGKTATIYRNIKNVRIPKIEPDDPKVRAVLDQVSLHPEFALSRRELIRYVLAEPGKRSKEVQALLRLDELETLRSTFQKIANNCEKAVAPLERAKKDTTDRLVTALAIPLLTTANLLGGINERRATLALAPLTVLEANTSIKDGLATAAGTNLTSRVPKTQALADLKAARDGVTSLTGASMVAACNGAAEMVTKLGKDAESLDGVSREALLKSALALFDDHTCPVCDTPWEPAEFRKIVTAKLQHFDQISRKRAAVGQVVLPILEQLEQISSGLLLVAAYGPLLNPVVGVEAITDFATTNMATVAQLKNLIPLIDTLDVLEHITSIPDAVVTTLHALNTAVAALPEPNHQDAARDYLTVGQERLEALWRASLDLKATEEKAKTSRAVFDLYGQVTTNALDEIYKKVEASFKTLYRAINHEDEANFEAQLKPSIGKLGFDVDFYGRGFFPPGAYHSEGHQDGMGLCLYLALMTHLLGKGFTFAVLDDVLMSVDAGHRREVSKLLSEQFPNTQFILTTHDEIWLRHMKTVGLIESKSFAHFRTWHVDAGPTEWDDRDVWEELDGYMAKNDVRSAAALLRHYLEHFSKELCQRLRAQVEFRGDAQFMLGELLPNAIGSMKRQLKAGKSVAQSWGQPENIASINALETSFGNAATQSNVEQWQVNAAVHYNEWATLQKADFKPVVGAFKALTEAFRCADCMDFFYVSPERGEKESLRCACGIININLLKKAGN